MLLKDFGCTDHDCKTATLCACVCSCELCTIFDHLNAPAFIS